MQLLHEIRREYQREHRTYLLSLAVAAPSAFVEMCYDVPVINDNVDFVNIMTYDYHFYAPGTPYVGELWFSRKFHWLKLIWSCYFVVSQASTRLSMRDRMKSAFLRH